MPQQRSFFDILPQGVLEFISRDVVHDVSSPRKRAQHALALLTAGGSLSEGAAVQFGHLIESSDKPYDDDDDALSLSIQAYADFDLFKQIAMALGNNLHTITFHRTAISNTYMSIVGNHCKSVRKLYVETGHLYISASELENLFSACPKVEEVVLELDYVDASHINMIARYICGWKRFSLSVGHVFKSKSTFSSLWTAVKTKDSALEVFGLSNASDVVDGCNGFDMPENFTVDASVSINGNLITSTEVYQNPEDLRFL